MSRSVKIIFNETILITASINIELNIELQGVPEKVNFRIWAMFDLALACKGAAFVYMQSDSQYISKISLYAIILEH